jgi:hypothetical protein
MTLPLAVQAATWSSCDKWATWSNGGYTVRNDVWGSNPGWQCIWANNGANWGVSCNHGSSGGIKSYPHNAKYYGRSTSSLSYIGTWFSVNRPSTGAYCTAFDIWANGSQHEVMLWMNKQGAVGPIGSLKYSNVSVGGHTWNVYRGNNGSINVMSFIRTSNSNSGNVDHKAIFNWIQARGWWNNPTIGDVQFGFEITNTSNSTQNFTCNGRSDWSN